MSQNYIDIQGARVHNLKNIRLQIPHNQLIVITGLSGSGKSSLAFDTLFAEGQRRYVESLSAYARQFLGRINKPDVDLITGIAPAIAIEQKVNSRNPRSTVGTSTEIYDYLKLLFARIGKTYSPVSGKEVKAHSVTDVADFIASQKPGTRVFITAPVKLHPGQGVIEKLTLLVRDGLQRVYIKSGDSGKSSPKGKYKSPAEGETLFIEELLPEIEKYKVENIYVVVDRLASSTEDELLSRAADSAATAFSIGEGECEVVVMEAGGGRVEKFSNRFEADGITFEKPSEHLFAFNNPLGACKLCEGYGRIIGIDEDLVIPDKSKSVYEDAVAAWRGETMKWWKEQLIAGAVAEKFPIHRPYYQLTGEEKRMLWKGTKRFHGIDDFFASLEKERYKVQYRVLISRYTGKRTCPECEGGRLRSEASYVKVGGYTIVDFARMPVAKLSEAVHALTLDSHDREIASRILTEITNRLQYMIDVGLGYLTPDRLSSTLSGGESQRINLSTSLGSSLVGSMYILDEPSIGLHPRDTDRLIHVLKQLRDLGNTVIVVEHEEQIMRAADQIIDIGPLAGVHGGEVVFQGTHEQLEKASDSLTAQYLTGKEKIEMPPARRHPAHFIEIKGARENNLKNIDVKIPLNAITCVTGVSGSGKSSLVGSILYPALHRHFAQTGRVSANFDGLEGDLHLLKGVEMIDQHPIGRSSRSNPVTYIKAYDEIRKLFSEQPQAKALGLTPSSFSFNIAGGRCEECQGEGVIRVEMQFMADIEMECDVCGGKRFKDDILEIKYRGKSIYDVLEMSVEEAMTFFGQEKNQLGRKVAEKLKTLSDAGLGYVKLGQSSSTLSGGESQRVKLASFLLKENSTQPLIFIFDEPTTGLHFHDIRKLLDSFNALIGKGHTIVIVEHNMEVIKCADWVVDLGPEAGVEGGSLVFQGSPEALLENKESYTGKFLRENLSE